MKKIILAVIILILLSGCNLKKGNDNLKFKEEYENVNETLLKVNIPEKNYMKYATKEEVLTILEKGTGVIYFGNKENNECREMVGTLIEAVDSTDLNTIYYYNEEDLEFLKEYVKEVKIPLVLFVYEGKVKSYKQGLDERNELFDTYLDGVHDVLNDICEDECDD